MNLLFGRIPRETDKTYWEGYTFEIVDMDNTRIDKILVSYVEPVVEQNRRIKFRARIVINTNIKK